MITIYKTDTMLDASRYVLNVLKKVDKANLNVMHTIIVPDRASLEAERDLLRIVGGSINIQVKTFRRLANDILPKFEYLSKQAGVMALTGIIADNSDRLTCYAKGINNSGFAENMYDTISMMKYCRISPERLEKSDLPKSVKSKAQDIAVLYRAYLDFTRDRFVDSADKMELLREYLPSSDKVANAYFYLYDFDNFSAQELALIEQIMLCAKGVTVACCVGKRSEDKYLYLDDIYRGVTDVCERNGITPNVVEGASRPNRFVGQIGRHLYRYGNPEPIFNDGFAEIFQAETRAQEVYSLACKIQRYVRKGGRYRDVFVALSDINKYFNAITLTFNEFNIPYFCDRTTCLADHPYARFVLDYLTLCKYNGRLDKVLPFVKNCLFCGFDESQKSEEVYHFENYCLKYNVSFKYDKFTLGQDDPLESKMFRCADSFRAKFNKLYSACKFPAEASVKEYVKHCREFIEATSLNEKNDRLSEKQAENKLEYESKVSAQAQEKFEGALLQAENVIGERYVTLDEFIKTLLSGVAAVNISVIPVHNDCVILANMAKARKHDIKFLALLGANYGAMPIVKSDCRLLNDKNIADMENAGINFEPQIFTENKRERFSLFQLLQEPSEKLYVSYAQTDGGVSLIPSPFVTDLQKMFVNKDGKRITATSALDEGIFTREQAISKLVQNKRKEMDNQPITAPSYSALLNKYAREAMQYDFTKDGEVRVLRGSELFLKNAATSVSQITDFYKCPYKFFIKYGLNIKPRTVSKLQAADLGNILHSVLELYVRVLNVEESDEVTEQKAEDCFDRAMADDFYTGMKSDPQMAGVLYQLRDECLQMCKVVKKQLADSEFVNLQTEMAFGGSSENSPVVVAFDGGQFNLVGKIDRVDVDGDGNFIVIDYKSSNTSADYKEEYVYVGHKLQLLVYVAAVEQIFNLKPAGFYYFAMHNDFDDVNKKKIYEYTGRTVNDVDIACKIDKNLARLGESEKLGLRLTGQNAIWSTSRVLTSSQIQNQITYAFRLISAAGELMAEGFADISPYKDACKFCDYKDVCDFGDVFTRNPREVNGTITSKTIDEVL